MKPHDEASEHHVSIRAVLLALPLCLVIAAGEPYGVLVLRGSPLAADFSTGAAIFLFFVLTLLVNPVAQLITGSCLRRGELATIYIMMIVAAAIPSWGFTMNLIPLLGGFFYYATPENEWAELIQPHLPEWLVPDAQNAIWKLFEGASRNEAVPWEVWSRPLLAWGLFVVTMYFVTLCLLVILRKQWVERERLLFPLAILPLEMSDQQEGKRIPAFFCNSLTWVGFAIPAFINTLNALHKYYNFIPQIDLRVFVPLLRNTVNLNCQPRFEVIGLSYLLSLDVSFGVWFFAFLSTIQIGVQRMLGWSIGPTQPFSDPAPPSVAHMALGALFFLVVASFWNSREHIGDVLRKAFRGDPEVDDQGELLSYRTAVFGTIAGFLLCLMWLYLAGMNLLTSLIFLVSALVIFVGLARIVSQTGLAYGRATVCAPVFTVNTLGTSLVGPAGLAGLGLNFAWAADVRTFVMASAATGLKLAEVTRLEYRRLFWAIVAAILVTLAGSIFAVIKLAYTYGGINLTGWQFIGLPSFAGNWITSNINNPEPIHLWHLGFVGIGASLMGGLTYIKSRFIGFPIHPIGMALGLTHPISQIWFSVFMAWLFKAVILKYGGAKIYMRLRPFFLGMVLGAFGSAGIWLIIDYFTGMSGNVFTLG
ncbi:MAG: hypothetical protein HOC74_40810 [Gemmatimonadetes bacterium]|nr:hypothetical protein [Gemmatimonadota bacterium]